MKLLPVLGVLLLILGALAFVVPVSQRDNHSLRVGDTKARAYRQMQVAAAIRFCDLLFGADYASLMSRAVDNALTGERKPASRAGQK